MKHLTVVSVAGAIVILLISIFAVKISSTVPAKVDSSKAPVVRTAKMTRVTFIGVVKGLSDTTILVERAVKGKVELIEFVLDKPTEKIEVEDKVKVSYLKKEGKNIATMVSPIFAKKIINKNIPL
jgi:phage tail tube protein FII